MSSSLRRGALAASAIVFSIASLAACGAGNNAQTLEIKPDNAATSVGNIKIQNAVVITQPDAKSTGPVAVAATVFNTGQKEQTLQSISVPGAGSAQLKPAKGQSLTIPAHGSLVIGGKDNASALLANSGEAIKNGNAQKVTFAFSESGAVNIQAFVVPATSYFSTWGPSEIPAAPSAPATSATASATASGAAGATSSASGKPATGGKNSPSATATTTAATPSDSASQSSAGH
ncbi:copper chaperone PCu(A)C [Streptomyces sp. NPDC002520]